jgi:hypothetical protein
VELYPQLTPQIQSDRADCARPQSKNQSAKATPIPLKSLLLSSF